MESLLLVVMVVALVFAVAMSMFAWRVLRRDRGRTEDRVARLRALATAPEPDLAPESDFDPEIVYHPAPGLFAPPAPARTGWGRSVLVVVVFMAAGAGTVYGLYGMDQSFVWPSLPAGATTQAQPLELLSLTHRRESGGDFVVTGLVQNPSAARQTPALVAVVYLFDADGQYFTSGKAAIDVPTLAPGDQSPFLIRIPNISKVSRYRLGFRLGDGGVFAHVDRRGEPLIGTTAANVEDAR